MEIHYGSEYIGLHGLQIHNVKLITIAVYSITVVLEKLMMEFYVTNVHGQSWHLTEQVSSNDLDYNKFTVKGYE